MIHDFHGAGTAWTPGRYNLRRLGFEEEGEAVRIVYQGGFSLEFRENHWFKGPELVGADDLRAELVRALDLYIPELDYPGLIVLDFEAWPPTLYDPFRPEFVEARTEAAGKTLQEAEAAYRPVAMDVLALAVEITRQARRRARVGLYGMGPIFGGNVGPTPPTIEANDRALAAYALFDVLILGLYQWDSPDWTIEQPRQPGPDARPIIELAIDEAARIQEAIRLITGRKPPIIPFVSMAYGAKLRKGIVDLGRWDRQFRIIDKAALATDTETEIERVVHWISAGDSNDLDQVLQYYFQLGRGPRDVEARLDAVHEAEARGAARMPTLGS